MLTVTTNTDGTSGYMKLSVKLVNWIYYDSSVRKRLVIHAHTGIYYMPGPLVYCKNALKNSGYKFISASRSSIFNADNVVSVNSIFKEVHFRDTDGGKKEKCEISHNRFDKAMIKLGVYNPGAVIA
ncbi:LytTR family transcriptional regulator DNA-binding domain-containing protein [Paenibacillus sp. 1-18]|uniref:LytTR family transcriptional regulator DNA-binding domain-containing protein n=1 Tax=Paenibacillus sp. 1-18 TaxID=1333846 RepID=UPI00047136BB|nr:LytTR family transcriptional regulator DNA-binding domain-containing protein [Paenibacillus sp. 1-18]